MTFASMILWPKVHKMLKEKNKKRLFDFFALKKES